MTVFIVCDKDGNPVGFEGGKYKMTFAHLDKKTAEEHCEKTQIVVPFKSKKVI